MSEMVERVARAVWEATYTSPWGSSSMDAELMEVFRSRAVVAIKAMREPTEAMLRASYEPGPRGEKWRAMIDEALK